MVICCLGPKKSHCLGVPGMMGGMKSKDYMVKDIWKQLNTDAPAPKRLEEQAGAGR